VARGLESLGIEVRLLDDAVVVVDFGSTVGMLCAIRSSLEGERELRQEADRRGMGFSALGSSYSHYDRGAFIDMLNDWGWTGKRAPPDWCTGEPRTD
jgi:hypothetical protein